MGGVEALEAIGVLSRGVEIMFAKLFGNLRQTAEKREKDAEFCFVEEVFSKNGRDKTSVTVRRIEHQWLALRKRAVAADLALSYS